MFEEINLEKPSENMWEVKKGNKKQTKSGKFLKLGHENWLGQFEFGVLQFGWVHFSDWCERSNSIGKGIVLDYEGAY